MRGRMEEETKGRKGSGKKDDGEQAKEETRRGGGGLRGLEEGVEGRISGEGEPNLGGAQGRVRTTWPD